MQAALLYRAEISSYYDILPQIAPNHFINRQQSRYIALSKTLLPKSYTIDFGFEFLGNTCETGVIAVNLDPDKLKEHILTSENDCNEINFINQNIISMIRTQNDIEKELVNKINTLKVAQTAALQTQINPHFLFNTLNLVNVIVMQNLKKENDAEKVISLLAEMLRGTLSTNEFITSVSEELHNTKLYVEIERIKYKNNFDIYWDIDDNVANILGLSPSIRPICLPPLLLKSKCSKKKFILFCLN